MVEDNDKGFSGGIWDGKNSHCVINGYNKFKRIFIRYKKNNFKIMKQEILHIPIKNLHL